MKRNGFTLLELLIVIAIIGVLGIAVLTVINPIEQINRGRDTALLTAATEVYEASLRTIAMTNSTPWREDLSAVSLVSPQGLSVLNNLATLNEIKSSFISMNQKDFYRVFLTGKTDLSKVAVCFAPLSSSFKMKAENSYNARGEKMADCSNHGCYTCLVDQNIAQNSGTGAEVVAGGGNGGAGVVPTGGSEEDLCRNFDPEYPRFAWTCNYSDKWAQYDCSNYCVGDDGCNSGCPPGQRKLTKSYYYAFGGGPPGPARTEGERKFANCLSHQAETFETYCVDGIEAGCSIKPYQSSDMDFEWGCTNPRRPYKWKGQ